MRRTVSLLALVLVLAGCGDSASDEGPSRQEAGIHRVARDVAQRPGVVCAQGALNTEGLPRAPQGSFRLDVTTSGLSESQQRDLLREIARSLWVSDLSVTNLVLGTPGGLNLADALGLPHTSVRYAELEAAFGPRPAISTPLPAIEDPGNPECTAP